MKNYTLLTLLFCLYICCPSLKGQQPYFENCYGPDASLYNGSLYAFHMPANTEGIPFYETTNFSKGSCRIRGIIYTGLQLNYDIYNQQVVFKYAAPSGGINRIVLSDAWLESFRLGDENFIVLRAIDSGSTKIFRETGSGSYRFLNYYYKELINASTVSGKNLRFSTPIRESYLLKNGDLLRFRGNKSFIRLFNKTDWPELRRFMRQNDVVLRKPDDRKATLLLDFLMKGGL